MTKCYQNAIGTVVSSMNKNWIGFGMRFKRERERERREREREREREKECRVGEELTERYGIRKKTEQLYVDRKPGKHL